MKKFFFLTCLLCFLSASTSLHAQKILKKVKEAAKQTAEQKAEQKTVEGVNQGVDKGLEGIGSIFRKKSKNKDDANAGSGDQPENEERSTSPESEEDTAGFGVYSNFTFEPGNKIIFYEDFEKDAVGDFPVQWETSGSGEVVTTNRYEGKWLSLTGRSGYLPATGELPENYTVEFDILTNGFSNNNSAVALTVAFLKKKHYSLGGAGGYAGLRISLHKTGTLTVTNTGAEKSPRINTKLDQTFPLDKLVHVSMAINQKRLRVWMEEEKIVDLPTLLVGNMGRYLLFEAFQISPTKNQSVLLSNFKVAEAKEDIRSQLLDKGRFSTTGIYFNTNKAKVKPESYAVLKSVADYLAENPAVKVQIVGHTDSQGEDAYNQQLSEKRAEAVLRSLVRQFGIEESRLTATGKGETEPVEDNNTEKGRANNRRVEFIKTEG